MTAEDLLNAYRDEMAPTLGRAFIEGFIARNRSSLLRMLAPLVALMNERMQAPRVREARREEDPDAVTPEKDAIVWAAFMDLVNQKRRQFGMQELEVTESMPTRHPRGGPIATNEITESMSVFGRREPDRKEIVEFIQEIKETRKSDWRLAEVLAMHFEVPEAKIVEWLNSYNVCPGATPRTMASKCDQSRYKAPKKAEGWLSRKLSGRPKREDLLKVIREIKRERRGDWMLAPTLAGSFGVPDATIVEWLRYHDICPRATTRSMASQCVIEDVESLPSPGSCGRTSKERRQAEHIAESYESRGVDPRTSKSRACATVNARRNEIMEPLLLPRSVGRMGDGFTVGEHVIRIGDMIKMEGQLGGYVVGVDRNLGIAKIEQDNGEIKTWPLASLLHDTKANRQRQQDHNDKINAEAEARLELSLADWRAPGMTELTESTPSLRMKDGKWSV